MNIEEAVERGAVEAVADGKFLDYVDKFGDMIGTQKCGSASNAYSQRFAFYKARQEHIKKREMALRYRAKKKGYRIKKGGTGYIAVTEKTGGIAIAEYDGPNCYQGISLEEMEEHL